MYEHELSIVIQQERERAIREARLHHRHDLAQIHEPSWLRRLVTRMTRTGSKVLDQRPNPFGGGPALPPAVADTNSRVCADS